MSIIRDINYITNDTVSLVIRDLCERSNKTGLAPIGIFESFSAINLGGHPACALGILPEQFYVSAWQSIGADRTCGVGLYQFQKNQAKATEVVFDISLHFVVSCKHDPIAMLSFVCAFFLFSEREWFKARTLEKEQEKTIAWVQKHFEGFEAEARHLMKILDELARAQFKRGGKLVHEFQVEYFKVV